MESEPAGQHGVATAAPPAPPPSRRESPGPNHGPARTVDRQVPAGATRGMLVHTNDLYGLVTGVGGGAGGTDEAMGPDGEDAEPLRPGSVVGGDEWVELRAGYTVGAALFEEFDGVAVPSAGAFVGVLEYEVL